MLKQIHWYWRIFVLSHVLLGLPGLFAQNCLDIPIYESIEHKTLVSILDSISAHHPVRFYYKGTWIPQQKISLHSNGQSLRAVLKDILPPLGLSFFAYDSYRCILAPINLIEESLQHVSQIPNQNSAKPATSIAQPIVQLGDSSMTKSGQLAIIKGLVVQQSSQDEISYARIFLPESQTGTQADSDGNFQLDLAPGSYQVQITAPGYDTLYRKLIVWGQAEWVVEMDLRAFGLDEVIIAAEAANRNVSSLNLGLQEIKMDELLTMPAFLGETDVVQALLQLPGVQNIGEGGAGFYVRGGNVDQNLILQGDAPILNASHVLGFFSLFHSDVIQQVRLYKGHIPAQYGGRISSVLDVDLRKGNERQWKVKGGLGIVSSRLVIEGPIVKNRSSILFGLRSSYSNWVLRRIENLDLQNSAANFRDFTFAFNQRLGEKHQLNLESYLSTDFFQYSDRFGYSWSSRYVNGRWNHIVNHQLSRRFSFVQGSYKSQFFDLKGQDAFNLSTGMFYRKAMEHWLYTPRDGLQIRAGLDWIHYQSQPEEIQPLGQSFVREASITRGQGFETGAFVDIEWAVNPIWAISAGLRYSNWQQRGPAEIHHYLPGLPRNSQNYQNSTTYVAGQVVQSYGGWEPRISTRVFLNENSSLKASYNRLRQYVHLISNTTAPTPVDFWLVSNPHIPPQIGDSYSVGFYQNIPNAFLEASAEIYFKNIQNIVSYKDLPQLLLNPFLETALLSGLGRAYGIEVSVKRNAGRLSGQLAYSFARSLQRVNGNSAEEIINDGQWFAAPFDKPHSLFLNSQFRYNKRNTFSLNFTYSTGRPISVPIGIYGLEDAVVPHYSFRNEFRIPDYHRLDFAWTLESFAIRKQRFQDSFTFSVYNLLFRKNAYSVFFQANEDQIPRAYLLAILGTAFPALSYNFRF